MTDLTRRDAVQLMAGIPLLAAGLSPRSIVRAVEAAQAATANGVPFAPAFFTAHEFQTVRLLVDYLIPRDQHSGSATDASANEPHGSLSNAA